MFYQVQKWSCICGNVPVALLNAQLFLDWERDMVTYVKLNVRKIHEVYQTNIFAPTLQSGNSLLVENNDD